MKTITYLPFVLACMVPLAACRKEGNKEETKTEAAPELPAAVKELVDEDTLILPLKKGDSWVYKVKVEVPPGITSEGSAAVELEDEMERVYLGKMKIGDKEPEVDVFEVTKASAPVERELVEIHDDRILMRGSLIPSAGDDGIQWFGSPVLFVFAGMRPGQETAKLSVQEGTRQRGIQVVARENVTVPAGEFPAIRLLMTGNDGEFMLRKTIWFSPRTGIVKEEKNRYAGDKLLFRETTELLKTTVGGQ